MIHEIIDMYLPASNLHMRENEIDRVKLTIRSLMLENEQNRRRGTRMQVAILYADLIRFKATVKDINRKIIDHWSENALGFIKKRAWEIYTDKQQYIQFQPDGGDKDGVG